MLYIYSESFHAIHMALGSPPSPVPNQMEATTSTPLHHDPSIRKANPPQLQSNAMPPLAVDAPLAWRMSTSVVGVSGNASLGKNSKIENEKLLSHDVSGSWWAGCYCTSSSSSCGGCRLTKKSLVISKLSQELAILGATFNRFGAIPLYSPRNPSCAKIVRRASDMLLY